MRRPRREKAPHKEMDSCEEIFNGTNPDKEATYQDIQAEHAARQQRKAEQQADNAAASSCSVRPLKKGAARRRAQECTAWQRSEVAAIAPHAMQILGRKSITRQERHAKAKNLGAAISSICNRAEEQAEVFLGKDVDNAHDSNGPSERRRTSSSMAHSSDSSMFDHLRNFPRAHTSPIPITVGSKSELTEDLQGNRQARASMRARLLAQAMCTPPVQHSCEGSIERLSLSQPVDTAVQDAACYNMRCPSAPLPTMQASHADATASSNIDLSAHLRNIGIEVDGQDGSGLMLETRWFAALPPLPTGSASVPPMTKHKQQQADACIDTPTEEVLMTSAGLNSSIDPSHSIAGLRPAWPSSCLERPARGAVLYHAALNLHPHNDDHDVDGRPRQRTMDGNVLSSSSNRGSNGNRCTARLCSAHSTSAAPTVTQRRRPDSGCSVPHQASSRPASRGISKQGESSGRHSPLQRCSVQRRAPATWERRDASSPIGTKPAAEGMHKGGPEANITAMLLRDRDDSHLKQAAAPQQIVRGPVGQEHDFQHATELGAAYHEEGHSRGKDKPERKKVCERPQIPTAHQGRHLRTRVLEDNIERCIRSSQRQHAKAADLASQMARFWSNLERKKAGLRTPSDAKACFNEELPEWERWRTMFLVPSKHFQVITRASCAS